MQPRRQQPYRNPAYSRPPTQLNRPPRPGSDPRSGNSGNGWGKKLAGAAVALVVIAALFGGFFVLHHGKKTPAKTATPPKGAVNNGTPAAGFNKKQYSLTDPTSIWAVINKPHGLNPANYTPPDLTVPNVPLRVPGNESMQVRKVTAAALEKMFADAKTQGVNFMLASGYRSYTYQVGLYNGYVQSQGQSSADQASARPGHSEHQTGLAADIEPVSKDCELDACFGTTPEGRWLAVNAYKYGFIIRYTQDKVDVTGYEYEPWHVRYVGVDLATEMHTTHVETLEEFFGVTGGPNYVK
jgi:D-alanyl-D-alanine carboxypeptidase